MTAEDKKHDRKGSPVCVYGDMQLQENALISDFMSGPYGDLNENDTDESSTFESLGNQIMDYLFGRSPNLVADSKDVK